VNLGAVLVLGALAVKLLEDQAAAPRKAVLTGLKEQARPGFFEKWRPGL